MDPQSSRRDVSPAGTVGNFARTVETFRREKLHQQDHQRHTVSHHYGSSPLAASTSLSPSSSSQQHNNSINQRASTANAKAKLVGGGVTPARPSAGGPSSLAPALGAVRSNLYQAATPSSSLSRGGGRPAGNASGSNGSSTMVGQRRRGHTSANVIMGGDGDGDGGAGGGDDDEGEEAASAPPNAAPLLTSMDTATSAIIEPFWNDSRSFKGPREQYEKDRIAEMVLLARRAEEEEEDEHNARLGHQNHSDGGDGVAGGMFSSATAGHGYLRFLTSATDAVHLRREVNAFDKVLLELRNADATRARLLESTGAMLVAGREEESSTDGLNVEGDGLSPPSPSSVPSNFTELSRLFYKEMFPPVQAAARDEAYCLAAAMDRMLQVLPHGRMIAALRGGRLAFDDGARPLGDLTDANIGGAGGDAYHQFFQLDITRRRGDVGAVADSSSPHAAGGNVGVTIPLPEDLVPVVDAVAKATIADPEHHVEGSSMASTTRGGVGGWRGGASSNTNNNMLSSSMSLSATNNPTTDANSSLLAAAKDAPPSGVVAPKPLLYPVTLVAHRGDEQQQGQHGSDALRRRRETILTDPTFLDAQQEIVMVLMLGWMEGIRQVYNHTNERGIVLEKIRTCFTDILFNTLEAARVYKSEYEHIKSLHLDRAVVDLQYQLAQRQMSLDAALIDAALKQEVIIERDAAIAVCQERIEHLKANIGHYEAKEVVRGDLMRMEAADRERRAASLRRSTEDVVGSIKGSGVGIYATTYTPAQIERLRSRRRRYRVDITGKMPVGDVYEADSVMKMATTIHNRDVGTRRLKAEMQFARKKSMMAAAGITTTASTQTAVGGGSTHHNTTNIVASLLEDDPTALADDSEDLDEDEVVAVRDAHIQVNAAEEEGGTETLFREMQRFLSEVDKLVQTTDRVCHQVYGTADVHDPSPMLRPAVRRLEMIDSGLLDYTNRMQHDADVDELIRIPNAIAGNGNGSAGKAAFGAGSAGGSRAASPSSFDRKASLLALNQQQQQPSSLRRTPVPNPLSDTLPTNTSGPPTLVDDLLHRPPTNALTNADYAEVSKGRSRGSFVIPQTTHCEIMLSANKSLAELTLRMKSLHDNPNFRQGLELRAPRYGQEACPLCKRVDPDPALLQAFNRFEALRAELRATSITAEKLRRELNQTTKALDIERSLAITRQDELDSIHRQLTLLDEAFPHTAVMSEGREGGEGSAQNGTSADAADAAASPTDGGGGKKATSLAMDNPLLKKDPSSSPTPPTASSPPQQRTTTMALSVAQMLQNKITAVIASRTNVAEQEVQTDPITVASASSNSNGAVDGSSFGRSGGGRRGRSAAARDGTGDSFDGGSPMNINRGGGAKSARTKRLSATATGGSYSFAASGGTLMPRPPTVGGGGANVGGSAPSRPSTSANAGSNNGRAGGAFDSSSASGAVSTSPPSAGGRPLHMGAPFKGGGVYNNSSSALGGGGGYQTLVATADAGAVAVVKQQARHASGGGGGGGSGGVGSPSNLVGLTFKERILLFKSEAVAAAAVRYGYSGGLTADGVPRAPTSVVKLINTLFRSKLASDTAALGLYGAMAGAVVAAGGGGGDGPSPTTAANPTDAIMSSIAAIPFPLKPFPEHVVQQLQRMFGTRRLIQQHTRNLLGAIADYAEMDARVRLFGAFVTEEASLEACYWVLKVANAMDLIGPRYDAKLRSGAAAADEERHPITVPLDMVLHACCLVFLAPHAASSDAPIVTHSNSNANGSGAATATAGANVGGINNSRFTLANHHTSALLQGGEMRHHCVAIMRLATALATRGGGAASASSTVAVGVGASADVGGGGSSSPPPPPSSSTIGKYARRTAAMWNHQGAVLPLIEAFGPSVVGLGGGGGGKKSSGHDNHSNPAAVLDLPADGLWWQYEVPRAAFLCDVTTYLGEHMFLLPEANDVSDVDEKEKGEESEEAVVGGDDTTKGEHDATESAGAVQRTRSVDKGPINRQRQSHDGPMPSFNAANAAAAASPIRQQQQRMSFANAVKLTQFANLFLRRDTATVPVSAHVPAAPPAVPPPLNPSTEPN